MDVDWKKLIASIVICQLAGILGAIFTASAIPTWYASLEKPFFVPPSWTFSVVWTILYLMMGLALYLVWKKGWGSRDVRIAMGVFGLQLFLNFLWSILFFGLRSPLLGLIEIVFLWLAIIATIWSFYRISRTAGLLLLPYIVWVSFAALLNYYFFVLNP
ncbi:TspO/MBR family protein [Methanolobus halotolerans]|uniref:TspO/MBR family protein n=1 Tax=Methanolobus halotolerans TaxID=2052935 RepID=UPI001436B5E4|nr:TspO/MBR family protein [Methanolobus halotolerans]